MDLRLVKLTALLLLAVVVAVVSVYAQDLSVTVRVCDALGACTQTTIVAQNPSSFIPAANDTSANWSKAGLLSIGGIPSRSTQCGSTVNPSGLTPPVANDDAALINAAITACTAGQVVQLASGTFVISQSEYIAINKGVTLRGNGSCTNGSTPYCNTVITVRDGALADWTISSTTAGANCGVNVGSAGACTAATGVILMSPNANFDWGWSGCNPSVTNPTSSSCGTTVAADVSQGAISVQVAQSSSFSVGTWALIDESPQMVTTTNPTGGASIQASSEFLNSTASPAVMRLANPDSCPSACTYSFVENRLNQEIHKVTAIGAGPCPGVNCTLTFDSPLTLAFRQSGSHDARVYRPTQQSSNTSTPFLEQAGVENLTVTRPGNGGIDLVFCAYCWVKNVEVSGWITGAINIAYGARNQIDHSYFHDCYDCENNGAEYPISTDTASTENYIVNNIIRLGGKGMVGRGAGANVVAYNYQDDTFYMQAVIGDAWVDMGLNGSHYGGTHHYLFEGNWGDNCDGDETHGNAIYHTFFRNHCTGIRTSFVDPSQGKTVDDANNIGWGSGGGANPPAEINGPLRAAGPMAFNYWYAFAGNVLGLAGVTTSGNGWTYQGANCGGGSCSPASTNKNIWMSGWVGGEWPNSDSHLNINAVTPYIFKNGNYDYVNASIVDNAAGFSHTMPNSFYLTSAPSFFGPGAVCTYPWPWVTPAGGTPIQTNSCAGSGNPAKARWDAGTPFVQP